MRICKPHPNRIPQLRSLWKLVFGDEDAFLDLFFREAFSPDRCSCAYEADDLAGMLYWLPCGDYAYIYAVATHPDHRGKGICRQLMEAAHKEISRQGYAGAILYPQEEGLRAMYRKMGYCHETTLRELVCTAGGTPVALTQISPREYFRLRPGLLPSNAPAQGSPFPELAESWRFFRSRELMLAATVRGQRLLAAEYLGPEELAPGILKTLGAEEGIFRCPGGQTPFAMVCPLKEDALLPDYFSFPLD